MGLHAAVHDACCGLLFEFGDMVMLSEPVPDPSKPIIYRADLAADVQSVDELRILKVLLILASRLILDPPQCDLTKVLEHQSLLAIGKLLETADLLEIVFFEIELRFEGDCKMWVNLVNISLWLFAFLRRR